MAAMGREGMGNQVKSVTIASFNHRCPCLYYTCSCIGVKVHISDVCVGVNWCFRGYVSCTEVECVWVYVCLMLWPY